MKEEKPKDSSIPDFFFSPYFVCEMDNWHLKPGAPEDVKREFEEYMQRDKEAKEKGYIID